MDNNMYPAVSMKFFAILLILSVSSMYVPSIYASLSVIAGCPRLCACVDRLITCSSLELTSVSPDVKCIDHLVNCSSLKHCSIPQDIKNTTTTLDLSTNQINHLKNFTFSHLNKLRELNLRNNKISIIDSQALYGLCELRIINLAVNEIKTLDVTSIFSETPKLAYLYLWNNSFVEIPALTNLTNLRYLDLGNNNIAKAYFPPSFQSLTALETVKLSGNNLVNISADDMHYLPAEQIIAFACKACKLIHIDELNTFSRFKSLQFFNIGENNFNLDQLSKLIASLSVARNLTLLKLQQVIDGYNLPSDFFKLFKNVYLKYLSLYFSKNYGILQNNTFFSLKFLTSLDLAYSEITSINSDAFRGLDCLKYLNLEYVGVSFQNYQQLGTLFPRSLLNLSLSGNFMRNIKPLAFDSLRQLEALHLRKCEIYSVDYRAFALYNNIRVLDISHNQIYDSSLFNSTSFRRLGNLIVLKIADNSLNTVVSEINGRDLFKHLVNLKYLHMARNGIKTLHVDFFISLSNLLALDLNENYFKTFESKLFKPIKNLSQLFLAYNKIQIISHDSLKILKTITEINLEGNPFNCGCDLLWFLQWIRQTTAKFSPSRDAYVCGSPNSYRKTKLWNVDLHELQNICTPLPLIIYIIAASVATLFFILLSVAIVYRLQWYIKWFCYRCFRSAHGEKDIQLITTRYFIFVSYHKDEESWCDEFVSKLQAMLESTVQEIQHFEESSNNAIRIHDSNHCLIDINNDNQQQSSSTETLMYISRNNVDVDGFTQIVTASITSDVGQTMIRETNEYSSNQNKKGNEKEHDDSDEETKVLLPSENERRNKRNKRKFNQLNIAQTGDKQLIYYEKLCLPNKSRFEESAKAIYSCKFVIVQLSAAYLRDRRLQFELNLIQTAMTERYGYDAFNHIIFATAEPTGELMSLIPQQLRGVVDKSCITWNTTNEVQQNYFLKKLYEKLIKKNVDGN